LTVLPERNAPFRQYPIDKIRPSNSNLLIMGSRVQLLERFNASYKMFSLAAPLSEPGSTLPALPDHFQWNDAESRFREQDVEKLLDEAADYLERGLGTRTEWQELYEKAFRTYLEISEAVKTAEISLQEEQAGMLELPIIDAQAQVDGLEGRRLALLNITENLLAQGSVAILARDAAIVASLNQKYEDQGTAMELTREQVANALNVHKSEIDAEVNETTARLGSDSAGAKRTLATVTALKTSTKARRDLVRALTETKLRQAVKSGGAFYYPDRLSPLEERYRHDFEEALPRMYKAAMGLEHVYNFDSASHSLPSRDKAGEPTFFDDCFQWVRNSTSRIVALTRQDRLVTVTVSLTPIIGPPWQPGLTSGTLQFDLTATNVGIPPAFMTSPSGKAIRPRLRGFGLDIIEPPSKATARVRKCNVKLAGIDCLAGKVLPMNPNRSPDMIGSGEFWNLNPFSSWELDFTRPTLHDNHLQSVSDIWLTLTVAFERGR